MTLNYVILTFELTQIISATSKSAKISIRDEWTWDEGYLIFGRFQTNCTGSTIRLPLLVCRIKTLA